MPVTAGAMQPRTGASRQGARGGGGGEGCGGPRSSPAAACSNSAPWLRSGRGCAGTARSTRARAPPPEGRPGVCNPPPAPCERQQQQQQQQQLARPARQTDRQAVRKGLLAPQGRCSFSKAKQPPSCARGTAAWRHNQRHGTCTVPQHQPGPTCSAGCRPVASSAEKSRCRLPSSCSCAACCARNLRLAGAAGAEGGAADARQPPGLLLCGSACARACMCGCACVRLCVCAHAHASVDGWCMASATGTHLAVKEE